MNDNQPVCPYCITEINYDEPIDEYFDSSTYEVTWRGICPCCSKAFRWKEFYHYSRMDEFEEE
jgi:hypothetical protein